ncbi:MAG: NAD(P)/FAD-dependent oxidoreductase [Nitrososphaerota archaeon]
MIFCEDFLDLKIAIIGVGVAGSYLLARLSGEHQVVGFERFDKSKYFPVCAWATSRNEMSKLCKNVGLNFEDYVLHVGRELIVDLGKELYPMKLRGLCTFDKLRFVNDLIGSSPVKFGVNVLSPPDGYDLIIDATGFNRSLLPKTDNQYYIHTIQYRVKFREPPFDDFYIKPFRDLCGYLWYFPLGDNVYHVGAGDYFRRHVDVVKKFVEKNRGEILMKAGKPVRITPPEYCKPIRSGRIVGVGESIGTVYPALGEGIIPSIQSAEILFQNIENLDRYEEKVVEKFKPYTTVFKFIKKRLEKKNLSIIDWLLLIKIYLHMRFREERYGVEARVKNFLKVISLMKKLS